MAKRQRTEGEAKRDFIRLCCYVTLILAALLIFVNNVLVLIKDIALLLGIVFGAYAFARAHGKAWFIIFIIAVVLYVASAIMGLF